MTTLAPVSVIQKTISARAQIEVAHGSDWNDGVEIREGGLPLDLTGMAMELVVRPTHNHQTAIAELHTATGEILFSDAEAGLVQIYLPAWRVDALPIGVWTFHWRLLVPNEAREVARGPFLVHPARY